MRLSDIEEVRHLSEELAKLKSARRVFEEGPTKVRCVFYRDEVVALDEAPSMLVSIEDAEFTHISALAQKCLRHDIDEISAQLAELGVTPE